MGRKIFVSYKYADDQVQRLEDFGWRETTVRDYVDKLEKYIDESDHVYKGESDGEDLSQLSDDTIWEKLKDRIYDSTLTIVMISPGMRDSSKSDRNQWIPWEISYSLKETSRRNSKGVAVTSKTNAMLAIVLPDRDGNYDYYLEPRSCCPSDCITHRTHTLFSILKKNKFNKLNGSSRICDTAGEKVWSGECSYIQATKWSEFIQNPEKYIEAAYDRRDDIDSYEIKKDV